MIFLEEYIWVENIDIHQKNEETSLSGFNIM